MCAYVWVRVLPFERERVKRTFVPHFEFVPSSLSTFVHLSSLSIPQWLSRSLNHSLCSFRSRELSISPIHPGVEISKCIRDKFRQNQRDRIVLRRQKLGMNDIKCQEEGTAFAEDRRKDMKGLDHVVDLNELLCVRFKIWRTATVARFHLKASFLYPILLSVYSLPHLSHPLTLSQTVSQGQGCNTKLFPFVSILVLILSSF